jgi:hypothetical protein
MVKNTMCAEKKASIFKALGHPIKGCCMRDSGERSPVCMRTG